MKFENIKYSSISDQLIKYYYILYSIYFTIEYNVFWAVWESIKSFEWVSLYIWFHGKIMEKGKIMTNT